MKPTLLVLAAGMGSRYGGLKQIDPMGPSGETILDYSVFDALRAGFGKVVFIIRPDFEKDFRERIAAKFAGRIDVGFGRHLQNLDVRSTDYSMVGFTLKQTLSEHGTVARGVCQTDASGRLTDIQELTKISKLPSGAEHRGEDGSVVSLTGEEPVSMNMWGFTPAIVPQLAADFDAFLRAKGTEMKSEAYIPMSVGNLIRAGQATCQVLRTDSAWFGVTYREDKPIVQASILRQVQSGSYPASLWS